MKQRILGQSGITVSEIGLGCMSMNFGYGRPSPEKDMIELIHKAVDMGVTLFDTAESYGPYINEELVGKALDGLRDKVSIATKCGICCRRQSDFGRTSRDSEKVARRIVKASSNRLRGHLLSAPRRSEGACGRRSRDHGQVHCRRQDPRLGTLRGRPQDD